MGRELLPEVRPAFLPVHYCLHICNKCLRLRLEKWGLRQTKLQKNFFQQKHKGSRFSIYARYFIKIL